jgi:hypothetical protein
VVSNYAASHCWAQLEAQIMFLAYSLGHTVHLAPPHLWFSIIRLGTTLIVHHSLTSGLSVWIISLASIRYTHASTLVFRPKYSA